MKTVSADRNDPPRPRICVMFPGALGDFICFLPALQWLARTSDVDLFARSEFGDIVPPGVHVRSGECHEINRLFVDGESDDERLQKFFEPYRRIYSWMGSQQESFVRNLQSVACASVEIFAFRPAGVELHQADYYARCLDQELPAPAQPEISLRPEAIAWCDDFWRRRSLQGRSVLAIGPGSGARQKNWPEENFLQVAQWWRHTTGGDVLVVLGPTEAERGSADRLQRSCVVARDLTLAQTAALLQRSDLYLGNDSGLSHLAGAVGACSVVLFGPSNPRQWAPRGENITVLQRKIECSPCTVEIMKSCLHRACLTEFSPADVIRRIAVLPPVVTLTRVGAGIKV